MEFWWELQAELLVVVLSNVLSKGGIAQDLRSSIATSNLQKATGQSAANQLFVLQNATLVEREAICGNLVCEAGERSSGTGEGMLLAGLNVLLLTCLSWSYARHHSQGDMPSCSIISGCNPDPKVSLRLVSMNHMACI